MIPYIGNGDYCYANATAMLLTASGENVSPSCIEGIMRRWSRRVLD